MPPRAELKVALFERFARDLATIDPTATDTMLCPLCAKPFGREALTDLTPNGLSVEHIIPSALGGKDLTLTCRRCNNETASAVEAHFVKRVRGDDWMSGDGSVVKGKITLGNDELSLKASFTDGTKPVVLKVPGGKAEVIERVLESLKTTGEGKTFTWTVNLGYKKREAQQAALRIAYLAIVQEFGHQYILSIAGERIRALILSATVEDLAPFIIGIGQVTEHEKQPALQILNVHDGPFVPAFQVFIRVETAKVRFYSVLMPGPDLANDADFLAKLAEVKKGLVGKRHSV